MASVSSSPHQVSLLNTEHNPDMMLLAARALTFMADVLPTSCAAIVRHGAVPAFCARLLTIEYIDLAEQSLQVRANKHTVESINQLSCGACSSHSTALSNWVFDQA